MKHIDMKRAFCIAVRITLSAALLACFMVVPVGSLPILNGGNYGYFESGSWWRCNYSSGYDSSSLVCADYCSVDVLDSSSSDSRRCASDSWLFISDAPEMRLGLQSAYAVDDSVSETTDASSNEVAAASSDSSFSFTGDISDIVWLLFLLLYYVGEWSNLFNALDLFGFSSLDEAAQVFSGSAGSTISPYLLDSYEIDDSTYVYGSVFSMLYWTCIYTGKVWDVSGDIYELIDDSVLNNLSSIINLLSYDEYSITYWVYSASNYLSTVASKTSSIYTTLSNVSGRLYSNSFSVAYWAYMTYSAVSDLDSSSSSYDDSSVVGYLVMIYSRLGDVEDAVDDVTDAINNLDLSVTITGSTFSVDLSDYLEYDGANAAYWIYACYQTLLATTDTDVSYSVVKSYWATTNSSIYAYPTSITLNDDGGSTVQLYYSVSTDDDNTTYFTFIFTDSDSSYRDSMNVSGSDYGYLTYSLDFIPTSSYITMTDDYYLGVSSVSWFSTSVLVTTFTVAELLVNILDAINSLDLSVTVESDSLGSSIADVLADLLPDSLSATVLQVDFSDLLDSLADFNFNIGNLADITLDVSGVVDALKEYLYYSGYSAAQLLYLCWGELSGLDVSVSVPEVDFSDILEALGDIYDALTYVTDDDSLLSTASADGVAAVASTSTTYTNAQLLYLMIQAYEDFDEALDGIDSDLADILKSLYAEEDSDLLEALANLASSLLSSTLLSSVAASAAESLASTLLPLVVLNLTIDLFLTIVDIEPVEPEFDIELPFGDWLTFTDSYTLAFTDDILPVIQAAILILYAIGLAASFKSWVNHLGGD